MAVLAPNENILSPEYLALWLRSKAAEMAIKAYTKLYNRGMNAIPRNKLVSIPIAVPSFAQQREAVLFFQQTRKLEQQYAEHLQQRQQELEQKISIIQSYVD